MVFWRRTGSARSGLDGERPEGETPQNGRFMLHATANMYDFLLLDQEDGQVWQLQWSMDAANRGLIDFIQLVVPRELVDPSGSP